MNESEQPNPIDDRTLDALLRDVEVPAGLQDRLHAAVSDANREPAVPRPAAHNRTANTYLRLLVMAATVAGIAFLTWSFFPADHPDGAGVADSGGSVAGTVPADAPNQPAGDSNVEPAGVEPAGAGQPVPETELVSGELYRQQELAVLLSQQLEIDRLRSRLDSLKQTTALPVTATFSTREYHSLIETFASQSIVQLGGTKESAGEEMAEIVQRYPGSRGAQIAQDFINAQVNQ